VALLGDACHPTLPYQAQGAAMAVEDGCALGIVLGLLSRLDVARPRTLVPDVLKLYESMRKHRTTVNVQGAIENRKLYHMEDGPGADARNAALRGTDWFDPQSKNPWKWANLGYLKDLMGFDTIQDARDRFGAWREAANIETRHGP
jgi:salicylate hydroxylase